MEAQYLRVTVISRVKAIFILFLINLQFNNQTKILYKHIQYISMLSFNTKTFLLALAAVPSFVLGETHPPLI